MGNAAYEIRKLINLLEQPSNDNLSFYDNSIIGTLEYINRHFRVLQIFRNDLADIYERAQSTGNHNTREETMSLAETWFKTNWRTRNDPVTGKIINGIADSLRRLYQKNAEGAVLNYGSPRGFLPKEKIEEITRTVIRHSFSPRGNALFPDSGCDKRDYKTIMSDAVVFIENFYQGLKQYHAGGAPDIGNTENQRKFYDKAYNNQMTRVRNIIRLYEKISYYLGRLLREDIEEPEKEMTKEEYQDYLNHWIESISTYPTGGLQGGLEAAIRGDLGSARKTFRHWRQNIWLEFQTAPVRVIAGKPGKGRGLASILFGHISKGPFIEARHNLILKKGVNRAMANAGIKIDLENPGVLLSDFESTGTSKAVIIVYSFYDTVLTIVKSINMDPSYGKDFVRPETLEKLERLVDLYRTIRRLLEEYREKLAKRSASPSRSRIPDTFLALMKSNREKLDLLIQGVPEENKVVPALDKKLRSEIKWIQDLFDAGRITIIQFQEKVKELYKEYVPLIRQAIADPDSVEMPREDILSVAEPKTAREEEREKEIARLQAEKRRKLLLARERFKDTIQLRRELADINYEYNEKIRQL